jgi:hypothetical protein
MCKANGKEWSNYYKSERTPHYLQALQGSLPNGSDLVQVIGTGPKANGKKWNDYYRQALTPASNQPPISSEIKNS